MASIPASLDPVPNCGASPSLAAIGALVGDPVRAAVLVCLTDGSVRPASELARIAGASPQAASAHLAKLVEGGLLRVAVRGRHRFFSLASGATAEMIEGLTAGIPPSRTAGQGRMDPALCRARFCYDHLAGRLGVVLYERLTARGCLAVTPDGVGLSEAGLCWCGEHGIALPARTGGPRPFLRLCLDWTERRPHAGGRFGAALAAGFTAAGYLRRRPGERIVDVTEKGRAFFERALSIRPLDL